MPLRTAPVIAPPPPSQCDTFRHPSHPGRTCKSAFNVKRGPAAVAVHTNRRQHASPAATACHGRSGRLGQPAACASASNQAVSPFGPAPVLFALGAEGAGAGGDVCDECDVCRMPAVTRHFTRRPERYPMARCQVRDLGECHFALPLLHAAPKSTLRPRRGARDKLRTSSCEFMTGYLTNYLPRKPGHVRVSARSDPSLAGDHGEREPCAVGQRSRPRYRRHVCSYKCGPNCAGDDAQLVFATVEGLMMVTRNVCAYRRLTEELQGAACRASVRSLSHLRLPPMRPGVPTLPSPTTTAPLLRA